MVSAISVFVAVDIVAGDGFSFLGISCSLGKDSVGLENYNVQAAQCSDDILIDSVQEPWGKRAFLFALYNLFIPCLFKRGIL